MICQYFVQKKNPSLSQSVQATFSLLKGPKIISVQNSKASNFAKNSRICMRFFANKSERT